MVEFSPDWPVVEHGSFVPPAGYGLVQRYDFPAVETLRDGDALQLHFDGEGLIVGHRVIRGPRMPRGRRVGRVAALAHRVR